LEEKQEERQTMKTLKQTRIKERGKVASERTITSLKYETIGINKGGEVVNKVCEQRYRTVV